MLLLELLFKSISFTLVGKLVGFGNNDGRYLLVVFNLGVYTHQKGIFFLLAGISAIPIPRRHMAVNIVAREQGYKDM